MTVSIVFVEYPIEFLCYAKFKRKLSKILSNLGDPQLAYVQDPNKYVQMFTEQNSLKSPFTISTDALGKPSDIGHAILFSADKKSNDRLNSLLSKQGVSVRQVNLELTKVVNVDKGESYDVYIGRGSDWGNPYAIGFDGNREDVLEKFQYDFDRGFLPGKRGDKVKVRKELHGKRLGCHCKPGACHGDVYAAYLNAVDDLD